ncbi:uncharacterized protein [Hyperolius riggenbachi]
MGNSDHRCQWSRLGSSVYGSGSSGFLESSRKRSSVKYLRNESCVSGSSAFLACPEGFSSSAQNRQCSSCIVYQKTRRDSQTKSHGRVNSNHVSSPVQPPGFDCSISAGETERSSRLPFQTSTKQQRVVPTPLCFSPVSTEVGSSPSGPVRFIEKPQSASVLFKVNGSQCDSNRCPNTGLEIHKSICISTGSSDSQISSETKSPQGNGASSSALLAREALVPSPVAVKNGRSDPVISLPGSPVTGSSLPPECSTSQTDGVAFKRARLLASGCTSSVVNTLLKSKKPSTSASYNRVWKTFNEFANAANFQVSNMKVTDLLSFLQKGLELKLSYSTLRRHVSAISSISGISWSSDPLIKQLFRAAIKLKPPIRPRFPKWDLPLVLNFLSESKDWQNDSASIQNLSKKTVFLVAITSGRRVSELQALSHKDPFLVFYEDRLVLHPVQSFLPKVTSIFPLNQEWTLPSFKSVEDPSKPHPLDLPSTVKAYLEATIAFRDSDRLFILPRGYRKGKMASTRTLANWIVSVIQEAYKSNGLQPPQDIVAHSTRSLASSWASFGKVSLSNVCKAANWASGHTFLRHRCVDPAALTAVDFGKKVISLSVSNAL